MHFFLPRRVLAVVFSALLGVLAFSSVASAGIGVPARLVEHDSRSKMTIVDDESWPFSDEVETFSLVNEPAIRCGGQRALVLDDQPLRRQRGQGTWSTCRPSTVDTTTSR